jgi:hypothetical protein
VVEQSFGIEKLGREKKLRIKRQDNEGTFENPWNKANSLVFNELSRELHSDMSG